MNRNYIIAGASGLSLGLGIGLAAGLYIAQKKLETKYAERATQEIAEAKQFYSALNKTGDFATPESTVESLGLNITLNETQKDAVRALNDYQGQSVDDEDSDEAEDADKDDDDDDEDNGKRWVSSLTIPVNSEEEFNYDEEIKQRDPAIPYVVSKEEFFLNEEEFDQVQYTYYLGDSTVADETDKSVDDTDTVLGDNNLMLFGHGSGDRHIVYIRNENLKLDFEVVLSKGSFAKEVLGFIKHGDRRPEIRRFRGDDE